MVMISGRSLGARRPLFADFSVEPPAGLGDDGGGDDLRLRDVIAHVVRHEVARFRDRHERSRLDRVLSSDEIARGAERGAVRPEGRDTPGDVDPDSAVAVAHQAFEDGLYLVVIDEREHRSLDDLVHLRPDSRLTFVRLTFLAGA